MRSTSEIFARVDIHDLLVRLAIAQDERDWATLTGCYETDASYDHPGGTIDNAAGIVSRAREGLTPLDSSQHLIGTILIAVHDEDTASAVSYFQSQHTRRAAPDGPNFTIAGTYRDRLVCRDQRWRISHRTQEYTWRSGNPGVLRPDPKRE